MQVHQPLENAATLSASLVRFIAFFAIELTEQGVSKMGKNGRVDCRAEE